ncbi:MAG TPA: OsmC family protein [Gammaproteobacteria bacterium]|nr:OsmC family protein [Gammaproteobacteria bacterium]
MNALNVRQAQAPLRTKYRTAPDSARVVDRARTSGADASDPYHSTVEPMPGCGAKLPVGVHSALGGIHDAPTPGDILCSALAACLDSSVRMLANLLAVELEFLEVTVAGDVDVRGTMMVDPTVPVGFQAMQCLVRLRVRGGTDPRLVAKLEAAAEQSCVVLQTLRAPPEIEARFEMC